MTTPSLPEAAQAVIDRWDTPMWKDIPATGEFINALRSALAADRAATAPDVLAALARLMPVFEKATKGMVFTAERAGEVEADMQMLRAALTASDRAANSLAAPDLLPPAFQHAQEMVAFADSPGRVTE